MSTRYTKEELKEYFFEALAISNYLNKVISQEKTVKNSLIKRENRECFERTYYYEGKHYVVTGIGIGCST